MDQNQLLQNAQLALGDSTLRCVLQEIVDRFPDSIVGKIRKLNEVLEIENQLAASLRHAAMLARDFPGLFKSVLEREDTMINIRNMLPGEKIPFRWLGQKCQFSLSDKPSYSVNLVTDHATLNRKEYNELNFGAQVGFIMRIDFQEPVLVKSLQDEFLKFIPKARFKTSNGFELFLSPNNDNKQFDSYDTSIYNWFLFMQEAVDAKSKIPSYYYDYKIKYLLITVSIYDGDKDQLKNEKVRLQVIKECAEHFLASVK